jgi:hypothetical protein
MIKDFMNLKSKEEKELIEKQLLNKKLELKNLNFENLIDLISIAKTNLNNEIDDLLKLDKKDTLNNLFINIIRAKNKKIDKLVLNYNDGISNNKIDFKNNKILFENIKQINKVKIEIENIETDISLSYLLKINTFDGESLSYNIIPYNHDGLFSEYFELIKKNKSNFEITNKENIYFYSCIFSDKIFKLGNELNLKYNVDYSFENNKLYFSENIKHDEIIVKYLPSFNSYEINVNKKVRTIELVALNDKNGIDLKIKKSLVIS